MITTEKQVTIVTYASEVHPEITTKDADDSQFIEWADANPDVWALILGKKSKVFGARGSGYSVAANPVSRLRQLHHELNKNAQEISHRPDFWTWRAKFSLAHFKDKGFKTGFFRQWDGKYDRGCSYIDYTPATLDEAITRFRAWCDVGYKFETKEIRVDGKKVWSP
jgi:hypothetical protein